jgi:hypothetical protein
MSRHVNPTPIYWFYSGFLYWITVFNGFYKIRPTLILPLASGRASRISQAKNTKRQSKSYHHHHHDDQHQLRLLYSLGIYVYTSHHHLDSFKKNAVVLWMTCVGSIRWKSRSTVGCSCRETIYPMSALVDAWIHFILARTRLLIVTTVCYQPRISSSQKGRHGALLV